MSLEEDRAAEAESQARQAIEQFRMQKLATGEVRASAVLALAFVAQGKLGEARVTTRTVVIPAIKDEPNYGERLLLKLAVGRVLSETGKVPQALEYEKSALDDSKRLGYFGHELESRLALAEIELRSGHTEEGRSRLAAVKKDATASGFQLVTRKAERAE
jgi:hypothetical protein